MLFSGCDYIPKIKRRKIIKRFILHFGLIILFFFSVNTVNPYPSGLESLNDVDFNVIDHSFVPIKQGIYEFNATIQNNGDPLSPGTVPILWEKVNYELYFTHTPGKGILNESQVGVDLNDDNDEIDSFNVTWAPTTDRGYDAIINDGINDIHAYALCEGPPADPWSNQTCYLNGKQKIFQLGSETHFLYVATSNYAIFGLCGTILQKHPTPHFQFTVSSLEIVADNFSINGSPVHANYSHYISEGNPYVVEAVRRGQNHFILPNPVGTIGTGDIITFSCLLKVYGIVTCNIALQVNWSPDSIIRYQSILVDEEVNFIPLEKPNFNKISSSCTSIDPGIYQLQMIAQNTGGPTTNGTSIWGYEEISYSLPLTDGEGFLNESELNLDLNGDGNKIDKYEVKIVSSSGNFWHHDAIIGGTYAHSINDPTLPRYSRQFHVNNESRHFTLGTKSHFLYYAYEDEARFGFYSSYIIDHPSPFFRLVIKNSVNQNVNVSINDLKINGEEAAIAYTWITEDRTWYTTPDVFQSKIWTIPIKTEIKSDGVIDFSCTLIIRETLVAGIMLHDFWSPYGDIFLLHYYGEEIGSISFIESTTTDSTTLATTEGKTSPGFSFLALLLSIAPILALKPKRKRS